MKTSIVIHITVTAALALALAACGTDRPPRMEATDQLPPIFPDYIGVTIPAGIAPLNFNMADETDVDVMYVRVKGADGSEMEVSGRYADFDVDAWHAITEANRGASLEFDVYVRDRDGAWQRYQPFEMHVSEHPLTDYGVTYRRIAPGFETFSKIGIYQRRLADFTETPILEESAVHGQCLNCHYANRGNPVQWSVHVRGANGGTLFSSPEGLRYVDTRTGETAAACTYGYWHPEGRYCAFSLNRIYQNFYVGTERYTEPWDAVSDIAVLDTHTNQLIVSPLLDTDDCETTPAFSADGSTLYFCRAPRLNMPADHSRLRYSLCSVPFDAETGTLGERIDTVIDADSIGKSVSIARPSYDGRYLMYCLTDYGTTPVARPESDLWLMDLATGETRALDEVNSDDADAYHNWSGDSRWFLFGSKRADHLYSYLYLSSVGDDGVATKPFLLPQRNPGKYYLETLHSFNAPDFTSGEVRLDPVAARRLVMSGAPEHVTVRH